MQTDWNDYWNSGWENCIVVDASGSKIGAVEDVYHDTETRQPEWLRVNTGWFGRNQSIVPLYSATTIDDDTIQVPYDKQLVKDAPNFEAGVELSENDERELYAHYGFEWDYDQVSTGGTARDDAMTRSEEELRVGTVRRPSELVRLKKHIVTDEKTVTVPVQREEYHIEREPVTEANLDAAMAGPDLSESDHEITLHEEEPSVEKEVVPKERVRLEKDEATEDVSVSDELRREEIEVEREPARGRRR